MQTLNEKEWLPFQLDELFSFQRGQENNMSARKGGITPLVSAKANNNGIKDFVSTDRKRIKGNCLTLNNDGDGGAGLSYYQPMNMTLDTHVTALIPKHRRNQNELLFLSACISGLHGFFGHGLSISNKRATKIHVMLPVTDSGEPDYSYMAKYTTKMGGGMLMRYRSYVAEQLAHLEYRDVPTLQEKVWKDFSIEELFSVEAGKRLTNADKIDGNRPFIGATDNNNGITGFVGNDNLSRDKNVLGVNYNGAPCIAFYHPYTCIFTDDVKRLHLLHHENNEYILLFFKTIIMQQRTKYSYGYKFKENRMLRQKLMVPVDDSSNPDYTYMEQYTKNMMRKKYEQYLSFLTERET
ncbi:restriction endonuclease subunit S [uncultured Mitsuokella sp.]|uniref:restriction endonuclease subunit S n=1 Tax=uncultured Mitsuokella sp. TaxID=453120 RepID=UPI00261AA2C0|nr:restriction endonuclease subunit S [uncultured Mitsuokella sp.]